MPEPHIELEIAADTSLFDELIGIMSHMGFEGFWEDGAVLRAYVTSSRWSEQQTAELQESASGIARAHGSPTPQITSSTVQHRNWNEAWESTIHPIEISPRLVVRPSWQAYRPKPGQVVVVIDPKMSFGTGYHETTRLMLRLMERHLRPGSTVLDIGTGTGILAIAAVRLGARSAVGIDNDEWSYENAVENVGINGEASRVSILQAELPSVRGTRFDMIVANLQRNVIEVLIPDIRRSLAPEGTVLLSGLLKGDREPMLTALRSANLRLIDELDENEWLALVLTSDEPDPRRKQHTSTSAGFL